MIILEDGPAAGSYDAGREPLFLRAVTRGLERSVLDLVNDTPDPDETIHVYRREGAVIKAHLCYRGKDAAKSGWYSFSHYYLMPDVDGETMRSTQAWQAWAKLQVAKEPAHVG